LDVIFLFTNVPTELAIKSINKRWHYILNNFKITCITKEEFFIVVESVLNSTVFTFSKRHYKQIFETSMRSPLFPIIANIVLEDLEEFAIQWGYFVS